MYRNISIVVSRCSVSPVGKLQLKTQRAIKVPASRRTNGTDKSIILSPGYFTNKTAANSDFLCQSKQAGQWALRAGSEGGSAGQAADKEGPGSEGSDKEGGGGSSEAAASVPEPEPAVQEPPQDPAKNPGLKKLGNAYFILAAGYALAGVSLMVAPSVVTPAALPASIHSPLLLRVFGALHLTIATASQALLDAAENERLGSNTYKRLNLGVISAALGLVACKSAAEAAWALQGVIVPDIFYGYMSLISLSVIMPLYIYLEVEGFLLKKIPTSLVSGVIEAPGMLLKSPNKYSAAFAVLTVLGLASAAITIYAPFPTFQVFLSSPLDTANALDEFLIRGIGCLLLPVTAALYALQDAASRDRLKATTFRHLNLALSLTTGSIYIIYMFALKTGLGNSFLLVDAFFQLGFAAFAAHCYMKFKKA